MEPGFLDPESLAQVAFQASTDESGQAVRGRLSPDGGPNYFEVG